MVAGEMHRGKTGGEAGTRGSGEAGKLLGVTVEVLKVHADHVQRPGAAGRAHLIPTVEELRRHIWYESEMIDCRRPLDRQLVPVPIGVYAVDPSKFEAILVPDEKPTGKAPLGSEAEGDPILGARLGGLGGLDVFVAGAEQQLVLPLRIKVRQVRPDKRLRLVTKRGAEPPLVVRIGSPFFSSPRRRSRRLSRSWACASTAGQKALPEVGVCAVDHQAKKKMKAGGPCEPPAVHAH